MTTDDNNQACEVRRNDDGSLDEIVGSGRYHLEQMADDHWWMQLGPHIVHLMAKGKITAITETEADDPAPLPREPQVSGGGVFRELAERAIPFLRDEGEKYDDDGSNEPLELAREIEHALDSNHPEASSALLVERLKEHAAECREAKAGEEKWVSLPIEFADELIRDLGEAASALATHAPQAREVPPEQGLGKGARLPAAYHQAADVARLVEAAAGGENMFIGTGDGPDLVALYFRPDAADYLRQALAPFTAAQQENTRG